MNGYKSQSARDAERMNYGNKAYWDMLDETAQRHYTYFAEHGEPEKAEQMLTRSLSEALRGNDGE